MTVPRRQRARLDLELLQRVRKRRRQIQVVERIIVRAAVHDVGDAVGLAACHRDRDRWEILVGVEVAGGSGGRETGEKDQLGGLPAVQRHLEDALIVDHLSDAGAVRLDEARVRDDGHLFADGADAQRDVDLGVRAHLQHDAVADVGVEPLQDDFQLVRPHRQVRQHVRAVAAGEHGSNQSGVRLGDGHLGARNRAAAGVAHDSGNLRPGDGLSPSGSARKQRRQYDANDRSEHSHVHTSRLCRVRNVASAPYRSLWRYGAVTVTRR